MLKFCHGSGDTTQLRGQQPASAYWHCGKFKSMRPIGERRIGTRTFATLWWFCCCITRARRN